jgi:hypothetical protein
MKVGSRPQSERELMIFEGTANLVSYSKHAVLILVDKRAGHRN